MTQSIRSVVLLGKGDLAIRIAEWFLRSPGHELGLVVPVIPEPSWTDSLMQWALDREVRILTSGDYRELLANDGDPAPVDLAMSVFYDRIIRSDFIDICGRILNLHNGPLPRYRGVSPINWALKNNEDHHGVTIHEITPGIDDGPIVAQSLYPVYPDIDEVEDVYARALEFGWTLFATTMPILDRIVAKPQDPANATYYSVNDNDRLGDRRSFTRAASLAQGA